MRWYWAGSNLNCINNIGNVEEDGLVLHYKFDDFQEPTINLATGSLYPYTSYNTMTRNGQDITLNMVVGGAQYLTIHNGIDYNGNTITLSGKLYKNGTPHSLTYGRANTYHTVPATKWDFNTTDGSFEIVENCNASSIWLFHTPASTVGGDIITIKDFQVELKPYATPFVNGSREGVVKDYSGNNNISNLSVNDTPKWVSNGVDGSGAYEFKTVDYINLPDDLGYTDTFSAFAWFKSLGTPGSGYHIIFGGTALEISIPTAGSLRIGIVAGTRQVNNHGSGLTDGKWHHVGMVYTGERKKGYIDGVEVGDVATTGTLTNTFANRRIGVFGSDTSYYTNGMIDDARIYKRALSSEEVKWLYETTK